MAGELMEPVEVINKFKLICWPSLFVGFCKGWVTKSDISKYAVELLSADLDCGDGNVAELAGAEFLNDNDVKVLLIQVGGADEKPDGIRKWMLASLVALSESVLPEEKKIDRLQELYAEFDYPEDMVACSIYSQDSIDPLIAMSKVISSLMTKLAVSP